MTPLPQAAAAVGPFAKKGAQMVAKKVGPMVVPIVVEVVKPLVPEPDQVMPVVARLTPTGRLSVDIDQAVQLTEELTDSPGSGPLMADLHGRALKLRSRYRNAVKGGGDKKSLLEGVKSDLAILRRDIDAALK